MEILMLAGILVIAAGVMAFVGARSGARSDARPTQLVETTRAAAGLNAAVEQGSIAVLPFLDLSPAHDQEYFSDGLSEELLDVLARLPELRVAARTSSFSFKGRNVAVDSIGRALRVANVLEGSVRRSGERVRITAQLIDARTGYHRWSETYDRTLSDVFAVQDEISRAIVAALRVKLGEGRADGQRGGARARAQGRVPFPAGSA
jgi:TolB-like protein